MGFVTEDAGVDRQVGKMKGRVVSSLEENLRPDELIKVVVAGAHGQVMVGTDSRLFVIKPGMMAGATFGAEVTSWGYKNLVGIQVHKGMMSGSVIVQAPGQDGHRGSYWGGGKSDPAKAPNAIPVAGDWPKVKEDVAKLQHLIDESHAPAAAPAAEVSLADEMKKLAELHAAGVLNDSEFSAAKQRLLS